MLHGFTLKKAIMFQEFPDMELPEFIDLSQNLTLWSCDESVLCAVVCEAKQSNLRLLRHNSVFCYKDRYSESNTTCETVKKVKCTFLQALRLCTGRTARRESRGIALLFLDHGIRRG